MSLGALGSCVECSPATDAGDASKRQWLGLAGVSEFGKIRPSIASDRALRGAVKPVCIRIRQKSEIKHLADLPWHSWKSDAN